MEKRSKLNDINVFCVGVVIGAVISGAFWTNHYHKRLSKSEKFVKAYSIYYDRAETLLDSIDGIHNLDLMDTDLESDFGARYLEAKSNVDSLVNSYDE